MHTLFRQLPLLLALFLVACGSNPVSSVGGSAVPERRDREVADLAGTWEGLVLHGAALTYIKLDLSPSAAGAAPPSAGPPQKVPNDPATSRHYEGTAYAQSYESFLAKHSLTTDIASESVPVHAGYDKRIGTFVIQAQPAPRRGRLGLEFHLRNLGGVHDRREDALAGLKPSQIGVGSVPNSGDQYFLFARSGPFRDLTKNFQPARSPSPMIPQIIASLGGPSKSDLLKWAQPLYAEYPGTDLYRTGQVNLLAIKLFRDEHFSKYFGSPFDELSSARLASVARDLQNLVNTTRDVNERSTGALTRMFYPGFGDNAAMQTALWVKAQRYMRRWHDDKVAALNSLPGSKASLAYTDLLEQELAKVAPTLLWPSEFKADTQQVAQARQAIAHPALETMLAQFEAAPPSLALMNSVATWSADEKRLFGYLSGDQARSLNDAAAKRLDGVVAALLPAYRQRIANLGTGLPAVTGGYAWHRELTADFAQVARLPQVQDTLRAFTQQRAAHLDQAQADMLTEVQRGHDALPNELSQAADLRRLGYCGSLNQLGSAWFSVPGDETHASVQAVKARMAQLGGEVSSLLPPRLAQSTGYPPREAAGGEDLHHGFYRSKVQAPIALDGTLYDNDTQARSAMPQPIRDANVAFKSNIVWALFHGRFDELDSRHYKGEGMGSDFAGQLGINPRVHYAFVTYAGLSSAKNGSDQVGTAEKISWKTTNQTTGEVVRRGYGEIMLSNALRPFYADSYKLAESASSSDAIFGSNPLGIFQTILKIGQGNMASSFKRRPDGELQFGAAAWEQPIQEDIGQLLGAWPAQSHGLWQFQENLVRYMKQRPSLQSLYGNKS